MIFRVHVIALVPFPPAIVPVALEHLPQVPPGDHQLRTQLAGQGVGRWLHDVEPPEPPGLQGVDDGLIKSGAGRPEPYEPAVLVIPYWPPQRPVAPVQGALPQTKLVTRPFAGTVDDQPRGFFGRQVEDHDHAACVDGVSEAEHIAVDPQFLDWPADVRVPQPQHVRGHLGYLHEVA